MSAASEAAALLGSPLRRTARLHGGDLSEVLALELVDGREVIAKPGPTARAEARMLRAIRAAGAPAPEILAEDDGLLVLELLPDDGTLGEAWASLGAVMAKLHAARGARYGWPEDHRFGSVAIPNRALDSWPEFWAEYDRVLTPLHGEFSEFCQSRGASPLPARAFIHESPHLNFYAYPSEADYRRSAGLGPLWHNLDSTIRSGDEDWASPPEIAEGEGSLVYLSLGSLGSADTALMQGLIDTLDASPHRVIVSMGPLHDQLELGERMVGAEFLPQPSVLPHVDLVITHGGNNTVVESLHFGKPMIVLPLFWDQHDNAQRIDETGFGVRLDTYRHEPDELTGAIDTLIGDQALRERLARVSARLQGRGGVTEAAGLIEQAAATRS